MPAIKDSCVQAVKRAADLAEVVGRVVQLRRDGADFKGLCPFHEEKTPSFHVRPSRGFFKCFGCGKGGDAIRFVMETEGLDFAKAVETLAGRFGVPIEYEGPAAAPIPTRSPADVIDPERAKRLKRAERYIERRDKERQALLAMDADRLRLLRPAGSAREIPTWPASVFGRFAEGAAHLRGSLLRALAESRGWPVDWAEWLMDAEKMAMPVLPWCDPGPDEQRGPAFLVESPIMRTVADRRICYDLLPVGYHQRFAIKGGKGWIYAPYLAAAEKIRTKFQQQMVDAAAAAGAHPGETCVPALPFFLGSIRGARFLVIAEGQWDAVTFAGAAGWLSDEMAWPIGCAVMGSRGSTGVDTLLAYWREWILAESPAVLVLADNDKAGMKWDTPEPPETGKSPAPTFAEKLAVAGARRVEVARVRQEDGKDFNDFWRARHPSPEAVRAWLRRLGFFDGDGLPL